MKEKNDENRTNIDEDRDMVIVRGALGGNTPLKRGPGVGKFEPHYFAIVWSYLNPIKQKKSILTRKSYGSWFLKHVKPH